MCRRPRTDRNITDKSKEHARGTGQIPVLCDRARELERLSAAVKHRWYAAFQAAVPRGCYFPAKVQSRYLPRLVASGQSCCLLSSPEHRARLMRVGGPPDERTNRGGGSLVMKTTDRGEVDRGPANSSHPIYG